MSSRRELWALAIVVGLIAAGLFALVSLLGGGEQATPTAVASESGSGALAAASPVGTRSPGVTPGLLVQPTSERAPTQVSQVESTNAQDGTPSGGVPLYPSRRATAPDTPTPSQAGGAVVEGTDAATGAGATPAATATSRAEPTLPASPTAGSSGTVAATPLTSPSPNVTATPAPGATPTPGSDATPTALQTLAFSPTATPLPPGISGHILLDGQPVEAGLILFLEDQSYQPVAETTVQSGGMYRFAAVPPSHDGYNVTFNWERNQRYDLDEVIAWGWIGPVAYDGQSALQLPALEIGLSGLAQVEPEPDTRHSAASIRPSTPLLFAWGAHPAATRYWVDLLDGASLERVWHSEYTESTSTGFSGQLDDGSRIRPGPYWWGVGGRRTEGEYPVTVYGHLAGITMTP